MATSVVSFQARRAERLSRPAETYDRSLRRRVYLAWGLMFLNVLTFYKGTWNMLPLIMPIPSAIGKIMTQGALPRPYSWRGARTAGCSSARTCSSAC